MNLEGESTLQNAVQVINSEMKFADVHLSIFRTSFSLLQSDVNLLDLLLIFFFSLSCLFFRHFELLLILSNSLKFILNNNNSSLSILDSLISSLEFIFHHS